MRVPVGNLKEQVTIQHRVGTREEELGTSTYSWEPLATVWAEVQDLLPSRAERVADGVSLQRRPCRVRMRYRTDVTSQMRLLIRGEAFEIVGGPSELGFRDGLEMVCEKLSTEGEAP